MSNALVLHPIGIIRTPYKEKYDAPRQPGVDGKTVEGIITLFPYNNYEQALEDVQGLERIWIISWFHKNAGWKPKTLTPRSREKRGVFATRSPHRPNPIGISLCRLLEVSGLTLRVENPDLLDETPVLDIKPYLPYAESFPDSKTGWLEDIEVEPENVFIVEVSELAQKQAEWLKENYTITLLERAQQILSRDPFPHPYRRITVSDSGELMFAYKSWRVVFCINGTAVLIEKIRSGYTPEKLFSATAQEELLDAQAHKAFYEVWGLA